MYPESRIHFAEEEVPVDMDDVSKSQEILDESTIEDDPDKEPDASLEEDDEIEEVDEEPIDED